MNIKAIIDFTIHEELVLRRVDAKQKRVLYKTGGYTLKSLQRSMRCRKKASKPGTPPSAHKKSGALLRKVSNFDVNERDGSVIVGPIAFKDRSEPSGMPIPELLDKGGPVVISKLIRNERGQIMGTEQISAMIEPRPFVAPLFTDGGERFRKLIEKESL